MKKFLSRKFLITVATGLINILVITGTIPTEATTPILALLNGIAGLYVIVEGIIDLIKKQ